MKKIFSLLFLCLACAGLTHASHDLGGELAYKYISPGTYGVKYTHYANYNGSSGLPNLALTIKSPGCNTGRSVTMLPQGSQPGPNNGPAWPNGNFTAQGSWGYNIHTYTTTVTFTAAEQACTDWYLSVTSSAGPMVANLLPSAQGHPIYTEAFLKLGQNIINNSPAFDPLSPALPVVQPFQLAQLSVGATDADGDSLEYLAVAPLQQHNQPVTGYATWLQSASHFFMNPSPPAPYNTTTNPQLGTIVGAPGLTFSSTFPLPSFQADWNAMNPATGIPYQIVQVNPYFDLNSVNGSLEFFPAYHVHDTINAMGKNTYVVAFLINEYRKINGVTVKVGTVRRETVIAIGNVSANQAPSITNVVVNNLPVSPGSTINLRVGVPLNFHFTAADANLADLVQITSNADSLLSGATFAVSAGNLPTATLNWTPTAADVRPQPYYLRVLVKDNATPFSGYRVITTALRVTNSGGVTGTKKELEQAKGFMAYPNPFSESVGFKFKGETGGQTILIYNALGQQVDQVVVNAAAAGEQTIRWEKAGNFAAGTYVAKLVNAGESVETIKFSKLQ